MKQNKIVAAVVVALIAFWYWNEKRVKGMASKTDQDPAPPVLPPPSPTLPAATVAIKQISSSQEPAKTAIKNRVNQLYNSSEREEIFSNNNTRENIFAGLQYKSGVRTVLSQVLQSGNPDQFPIIPTSIKPQYEQALARVSDLPTIETFEDSGQFNTGINLWKNALDFSAVGGANLWPSNINDLMSAGLFFVSGSRDSNMSERFDSYCRDMAVLCRNASVACRSSVSHFQARAMEDLNRGGWNIY